MVDEGEGGGEYGHRCPACRMRRLKGCPDGSASTAWDIAGLLCNLYSLGHLYDPKRCHHSQTSRAQYPLNLFYTWCNMLLTIFHHCSMVSFLFLLPSYSFILPLPLPTLTCTRLMGNHNNIIPLSNIRKITC